MRDFVRVLQEYCNANSIKFEYGNKANLNLLSSDLLIDKVYCLLDPVKRISIKNKIGNKIIGHTFVGNFMLLKKSTPDMPYFTEVGNSELRSKYVLNIEPLLNLAVKIQNNFICSEIEINQFETIDAVDILDINKDGIVVSFNITIYE